MDTSPEIIKLQTKRQQYSCLMRKHHRELLVFAGAIVRNRDAAKDIVQEAFVSAWRKFERFDEERDFAAWMRGIVRNKCKDWFRKMNRVPLADTDFVELEIDMDTWHNVRDPGSDLFERVDGCLRKLPGKFREAVQQFYFEDQTGDEAASDLIISPANFRKRLERARGLLHDCLSGKMESQSPTPTVESHV